MILLQFEHNKEVTKIFPPKDASQTSLLSDGW